MTKRRRQNKPLSTPAGAPGSAAARAPAGLPPQHQAAWLLALGLGLALALGAPDQIVTHDAVKASAAACALAAAALGLARAWPRGSFQPQWSWPCAVPLVLAGHALLSTAWAPAATALDEAVRWGLMALAAWLALQLACSRQGFHLLAGAAAWGSFAASLVALAQFWLDIGGFPAAAEPGSTFGNRNFFAETVAVALPLVGAWLAQAPTRRGAMARGAVVGTIALALLATGSRAALVASLAVLALIGVLTLARRPNWAAWRAQPATAGLMVALALVATLGWVPTQNSVLHKENVAGYRGTMPLERSALRLASVLRASTYNDTDASFQLRQEVWRAGVRMVAAHPVRGVGAGAWNAALPLHQPDEENPRFLWYAHNEPLQLVAEYGLVGAAALLALWALAAWGLARAWGAARRQGPGLADAPALAGALGILAFGIASLAGLPLHNPASCLLLALCIGLAARGRDPSAAGAAPVPGPRARWAVAAPWAAAALLLAVLAGCVTLLRAEYLLLGAQADLRALNLQRAALPPAVVAQVEAQAAANLRAAFALRGEHGLSSVGVAKELTSPGQAETLEWLSRRMLETRPHYADLHCNLARAQISKNDLPAARATLAALRESRPKAGCLRLTEFIMAYRAGEFDQALRLGQQLIDGFDARTDEASARYVVDSSYRSAIRANAFDTALALLRVRGQRWPELAASSRLLAGHLIASRAPDETAPDAVLAFREALTLAPPSERAAMRAGMPARYQVLMGP